MSRVYTKDISINAYLINKFQFNFFIFFDYIWEKKNKIFNLE